MAIHDRLYTIGGQLQEQLGPANIGNEGPHHTMSLNKPYFSTGIQYYHSITRRDATTFTYDAITSYNNN